MTMFHFFNCALLAFGPHVVYYKATPLAEYGTWTASAKAALVYFFTMMVKLLLWASLLKVSAEDDEAHAHGRPLWHAESSAAAQSYDLSQELVKAGIGLVDLLGLYYALTRVTYRNISFSHKFQAVGLGWAAAQSLTQRLAPLWFGAAGMQFKWDYILDSVNSNSELILGVSLAAVGSILWLRKNKPAALLPVLYALAVAIVSLPVFTSYVQHVLHFQVDQVVSIQFAFALCCAVLTWQLYQISVK